MHAKTRAKFGWLVMALCIGASCLALEAMTAFSNRWHEALDYQHHAIAHGELWRLVTAHLMHLNVAHAMLDVAGLLLVAWIFSRELNSRREMMALLIGAAFVDFGLWFFHPEVERYVGLSGALHALFAAGAMRWLLVTPMTNAGASASLRLRRRWGAALLIGLVVKLVLEYAGEAFWLRATNFDVVTAAHRWGSIGGALYGAISARIRGRT